LLLLGVVMYVTGKLTGGFGLRILSSENIGGKRYVVAFAAILGFLAMIARPVPANKTNRYIGMFFLGSVTDAMGSALPFLGPQLYFLFLIFPIENAGFVQGDFGSHIDRLWGLSMGCLGVFFYLLARHGVAGTLNLRQPLRLIALLGVVAIAGFGGFRSFYILMATTFLLLLWMEGLLRSKYTTALLVGMLVTGVIVIPFSNKLPLSVQRTISFLPLNINPVARYDALASTDWRVQMWQQVLPEVPKYLWLGKGMGISGADLELASELAKRGSMTSQDIAILTGDYHSGPLSLIIPFGIWGVIAFLWFLIASIRALYLNYRYGDESLKRMNTFLLAYFVARTINYFFIFGGFYGDLAVFCGAIGLSISLNGGIRQPVRVSALAKSPLPGKELEPPMGSVPVFGRTT
jgi:O-antigen ligase/polysaccharide polymerase Wzy-like membrane protein